MSLEAAPCAFSSSWIRNKILKILRNKGLQSCIHTSYRKFHKRTGVHAPCEGLNLTLTNSAKFMFATLISWLVIQILKNEWAIRLSFFIIISYLTTAEVNLNFLLYLVKSKNNTGTLIAPLLHFLKDNLDFGNFYFHIMKICKNHPKPPAFPTVAMRPILHPSKTLS